MDTNLKEINMVIDLKMLENMTSDKLKKFEEAIKAESSQLEKDIEDKKVYTEDSLGNKYFIEDIDEYLELKSNGQIIKIL